MPFSGRVADRIVSLLPAATEICFALGLGERVQAVSHACNHPPQAATLPQATRTRIDPSADGATIDQAVRDAQRDAEPLHEVHQDVLHHAQPDLIITQDACNVCGTTPTHVKAALARIEPAKQPTILTLHPHTLQDVLDDIQRIAEAAGAPQAGQRLHEHLTARIQRVQDNVQNQPRPRALILDWIDPPMIAGHWAPDMLQAANAQPLIVTHEDPSTYATPDQIRDAQPDHIFLAPCGFDAQRAREEANATNILETLQGTPAIENGNVHLLDGDAYLSRPGPRLVDGIEQLATALHPNHHDDPPQRDRIHTLP